MLNSLSYRVSKGLICASLSLILTSPALADDDKDEHSHDSSKSSLSVSPTSLIITQGSSGTARVSNASGSVSASSSEPSVATARYDNGTVTVRGVSTGNARITVKDRSSRQTISVVVMSATGNLTVSTTSLGVTQGSSGKFTVSGATGTVTVSISDSSIASVNYVAGVATVTGLKVGSATVTVSDSRQSRTVSVTVSSGGTPPPPVTSGSYSLLAWNDLGMHCVDGKDYSIFSILPPYNNLHAQLVNRTTNKQVNSGVTLTYESYADTTVASSDPLYGSINTISSTKTNFWTYVQALFGVQPALDHGLNLGDPAVSNRTPGTTPAAMQYNTSMGAFVAEGIPIMPVDDSGRKNFYPMIKVVAKDSATGAVLATARTVLPVSDEMTCKACHSTTTSTNAAANAARPAAGWINDPDPEKDWKKNILRLHDERKFADPVNQALYVKALAQVGYSASGLLASATAGKPVLCAACHSSNALQTSGVTGVRALTHALHSQHATVKDHATQIALGDVTNRSSCYTCHPGSVTQCLRGAMSGQSMSCQSCHGTMAQVGNTARAGWLNEPNCQSCHHDGKRELVGVDASGLPKVWTDTRFATNANTPASGISLFRFSKSHGNLQCEACHGATHAEYPSTHSQDNALSMDLQGHTGTVAECTACHTSVPNTTTGGPHGMHTTGDQWVSSHKSQAKSNQTACAYCHGADYRGTPLSQIKVAKTINKKTFPAGHNMNCYDCHNGPNG